MLKLIDYRTKTKGLPDLLPYAVLVEPGVILNKDGSFMAGWEIRGQDTASSTEKDLSTVSSRFNNAVKLLGSGWMLHVDAIRSSHSAYPTPDKGNFPDPVTLLIDEERREFFSGNRCFSTNAILTVTYKPNIQAAKLAGKAQAGVATSGALEKALIYFQNMLEELEDALSAVLYMDRLLEYSMPDADGEDWLQSDLLSHIQHCVSGELQPVRVPKTPMYLDALLGSNDLVGGIIPRLGNRHLAVIALDGLPQESYPAMLRDLDALGLEYRFSSRFICLDQYDAAKEINSYRKGWRQQVYRFLDQFFNNPNARANRDALLMAEDAETALTEVQGGYVSAGYLTSTIVLMHENQERLQDWARGLRRTVQTLGFGCRIESVNALEAWLGTHPGNSYANLRRPMVNTLNLADLLPLSSVWTGSPANPCPFYPPDSRPLAVLMTDNSTPFWFNIHAGDLGHTLIFGPTGAGKSTLLAFIAAQFRCYENARIFAFDKGMSLFPLCFGAGGDHYNIGNADELAFAPLQRIDSEEERAWAEEWVASLMELQQFTVMPSHRNAIHTAMQTLAANPPHLRSLTSFYHVVQDREIKEAIQHYTTQGAMGRLLDADSDSLNLSRFMTFEIEDLMNLGDKNLVPVLTYLFRRIEKALDGSPTILVLDEAWIMLGHPVFRAKIREWLKVMRKANCAVILATQSLSDARNSGILDVLTESCPTKIFLPNGSAEDAGQKELYEGMGLNDKQISIIRHSESKRDYYIVSPQGRRKVQLALKPKALAFVGASDKESIARIRELAVEYGRDGWPEMWLRERGVA
ncbi:conjugal transfer protein TrbE [Bilophila wadsworthia]|uniref:VirB4 family type IV secretion/conjugal transfer ATPase n=1 Tax=Bilophila wadsworthia TaxID=35833 RepID=UPI001D0B322E|nr:conjugal transfer protein TrbE [Bilophila wadsworthia]MCB8572305.1 conjugal transfer protein TrbE [Bilophila wadsworthia]MCC2715299.1 conjugal transfer protein TrbE [Bilophila wadsworthia]